MGALGGAPTSDAEEGAERPRRILVIGAEPAAKSVHAVQWSRLPPDLNVADYDLVIVDLVPLEDERSRHAIDIATLPPPDQFARLIFSEGSELVFIGRPHHLVGANPYVEIPGAWLPAFPSIVFESGQLIDVTMKDLEPYFQLVDSYSFHGAEPFASYSSESMASFIRAASPIADEVLPVFVPAAKTRFGAAVGFAIVFMFHRRAKGGEYIEGRHYTPDQPILVGTSGTVLWLPAPTAATSSEAVDRLLASKYGVAAQAAEPEWLHGMVLPAEIPIRSEIASLQERRRDVSSQVDHALVELARERRFLQLLYERGEEVLEPVVREALRRLGADVEDPSVRGREDGRLDDPKTRSGTLEIKGRKGSLRLSDVRELDQWVRDSLIEEGRDSKGILVFNGYADTEPERRPDPFPPNCVQAAERSGIVLITSRQILQALAKHQIGSLDVDGFWAAVFGVDGVSSLPEFPAE